MTARVGLLVALLLGLVGGLVWWTSRGSGPREALTGLAGGPRAGSSRPDAEERPDTALRAVSQPGEPAGRESRAGGTVRKDRPAGDGGPPPEEVTLVVKAADGRPILEALSEWGLKHHKLTCAGTMSAPDRFAHGTLPATRAPFLFARMGPTPVDGQTTFTLVARRRPCFVSLLVSGVVIETQPVESNTREIVVHVTEDEIRAALGGLRLCLVAEGAEVPPRARAYLRAEPGEGRRSVEQIAAQVDRDGCIEFESVAPGEYQLAVYANRYASHFRMVQIEPSHTGQLGDLVLEEPVAVMGSVVGEKRDVANRQIAVQVMDRSGERPRSRELRRVSTDATGAFRLFDLAAGEYALHVVQPEGRGASRPLSRAVMVDTRGGAPAQIELPLESSHTLVLRNQLPRDAIVELQDGSGVTLLRVPIIARGVKQVPVVNGSYTLETRAAGRLISRTQLQTPPSLTATIGS